MLGTYLKINNVEIPNPVPGTFSIKLNSNENVYENEAGEQLVNIKRLGRATITATFRCTSRLLNALALAVQAGEATLTYQSVVRTGRLRFNGEVTLYEWSEYTAGTDGLWTVPIIFEEY